MIQRKTSCPACGAPASAVLQRARLPIMQNVVLETQQEAREARCAPFELSLCTRCGLGFNSVFAPELLQYDTRYDNDVPSAAFTRYYRDIARMLGDRLQLQGGTVYDVGCGKGTFLEALLETIPGIDGVGVDPSCMPRTAERLSLIRAPFAPEQLERVPQLVACRHVLEHIEQPAAFLGMIRDALSLYRDVPIYLEVPELDWIFDNGAFWDFCYEHCNYFTRSALAHTVASVGLAPFDSEASFQGQYQWVMCRRSEPCAPEVRALAAASLERAVRYAEWERERMQHVLALVERAATSGSCVLWGMATKGVVFANLIDPHGQLLAGGVDVNTKKQGHFVPGTGHAIHKPEWLRTLRGPITVIVMNPNYLTEITEQVRDLGVQAELVTL